MIGANIPVKNSCKQQSDHSEPNKPPRFMAFVVPILTGLFLITGPGVGQSMAGEVWVANMKDGNTQVIDTGSNQIVKTIATGKGAHNVTFSPDGKLAFIANLGTSTITIIDAVTKEKLADVAAGTKSHDVAVSPDGKLAVSCNVASSDITFIDIASQKALHTMATGKKAITAVFSPDGQKVYVVNAGAANISVVDVNTYQIIKTLPGAKGAMVIKPTNNWSQFWLNAPADNKMLLVNIETGAVEASIDVPGEPHGVALSADGKTMFVGQRGLGQVAKIDIASGKIIKTVALGKRPDMIAISSDGKSIYVAIRDDNKLVTVATDDLSITGQVDTGGETHGVAYRD